MKQAKIAIIGAGVVGSVIAYTLMMKNYAASLMLVDINDIKCKGEVDDLSDACAFSTVSEIAIGTLGEAGQADIIIIAAGIAQRPGQTRAELLQINYEIISSIVGGLKPINKDAIIIVVTNPVDILTYIFQQRAGLSRHQIFGSGTLLDTLRLKNMIGNQVQMSPNAINVYVLGEHGDSQMVAWSSATISDVPMVGFNGLTIPVLESMAKKTKMRAYDIIACKGSTAFGVAACVSVYCQQILFDAKNSMPVSCYLPEYDVCISVPAIIGKNGIERVIVPPLNEVEKKLFEQSMEVVKASLSSVK